MQQPGQSMQPGHHWGGKKTVSIAVIVVIIVVLVIWLSDRDERPSTELAPGQELVKASPGELVGGFPKEFLIEVTGSQGVTRSEDVEYESLDLGSSENSPIADSHVLTYEDTGQQKFARYSVSLGPFEINDYVGAFQQVLAEGGWTITDGSMFEDEPVPFLYARRGLEEVNITLKPEGEGRISVSVAHFELLDGLDGLDGLE